MRRSITVAAAFCFIVLGNPTWAGELSQSQVDELAREVSRVESVRAVKDLKRTYAQYAQFGLAEEMAALFAKDATIVWGDRTITGRDAIGRWLTDRVGSRAGLAPGAMHVELIDSELVNLSVDGKSARSRFEAMAMAGDGKGGTWIDGGTYEDEFVLEDGRWKIRTMRYFPQFEGNYAKGWANAGGGDLPRPDYHFTIDETGVPIPPATGPAPATSLDIAGVEEAIDRLNQEDSVRNLQNAFGYYVDRKMWDDVVDLFAEESAVEIVGAGVFKGKDGARRAMELMGTQGLEHGELNEHPLFAVMVEILPGHQEALTRGIDLGLTGDADNGTAGWEFAVFRNRFSRENGLWKIKELRIYPLLKANYADGWGMGGVSRPAAGLLPAFLGPNPGSGKAVSLPGAKVVGDDRLTEPFGKTYTFPMDPNADRLSEAKRRLARSAAYDAVENVSHAYGYYLTDAQWEAMGSIFALNGNKQSPFAGYYLGRDRVIAAATAMYGKPGPTRPSIPYHWRPQPVIFVSHDGRSANLRTRLFQPATSKPREGNVIGGGLAGGMYPNDQAVIENGIWRLWTLTIDEHYWTSAGWKGGWSAAKDPPPGQVAGVSPLVARLAPDILLTKLGRRMEHFRGGTGETRQWPQILPMWFNYRNPVSGRIPENYWPDGVPTLLLPESRLIANGYQMPPTGPEQDGIDIGLTPPEADAMEAQ